MIFSETDQKGRAHAAQIENVSSLPEVNKYHPDSRLNLTATSLVDSQGGVWCVLDFPATSVVSVEQGVFSMRGWAWSRKFGPGKLFVEIQGPHQTERRPIRHRYCRFDISEAIPEIPLDNYAGFEVSLDRSDIPEQVRVSLLFETPAMTYALNPISVKANHNCYYAALQEIACDCCYGSDLIEIGKKEGLTVRRCLNCGLAFSSPRPDFSLIQQRYSQAYFENEYLPFVLSKLEESRNYWNHILDKLEPYKRLSRHLFEVGVGSGHFLQEAAKRGWITSGIDVNLGAVNYARGLGLDVAEGDIQNVDLPHNKFGAIILESTLEHFLSPRQVLAKCAQALHPGGGISIGTLSDEGDLFMTEGVDFKYFGPSEHLFYFPASALMRLCESEGLRVEWFFRNPTGDFVALCATKRIDRWE
jgi:SAM-dependent methyltransferase